MDNISKSQAPPVEWDIPAKAAEPPATEGQLLAQRQSTGTEQAIKIIKHVQQLGNSSSNALSGLAGNILAAVSAALGSGGEALLANLFGILPGELGVRDLQLLQTGLHELKQIDPEHSNWHDAIGENWDDLQKARFIKGISLLMEERLNGNLTEKDFLRGTHLLINSIDVVQVDGSMLSPEELEAWEDYRHANPDIVREVNYAAHGKTSTQIAEAMRMLINGAYGVDVIRAILDGGLGIGGAPPGGIAGRTNVAGGEDEPEDEVETVTDSGTPELQTEEEPPDPRDNLHTYQESINNRPTEGPLVGITNAQEFIQFRRKLRDLENHPELAAQFEPIGHGGFKDVYAIRGTPYVLALCIDTSARELLLIEQMDRLGVSVGADWTQSVYFRSRFSTDNSGVAGIVMQRINGRRFVDVRNDQTLSPEAKLRIAQSGMEKAARMNVLGLVAEGDIKGDNFMVQGTEVIPIDFGLSVRITAQESKFENDLLYLSIGMMLPLVADLYPSRREAFSELKDWYLAEAKRLIEVSSTTGRTVNSTVRQDIYDRAVAEYEHLERQIDGR